MPNPVETPAAALMRLTNGYQVSQAIHVAAMLKLADFIGDEPVTADELAHRVDTHARSLYRLLRALSTVGIFRETDDRRFVRSPMSALLRTDHPESMWGWPAYIGRPLHRELWGDLLHGVRTGQDAPHHLWGVDIWQYRADKPEEIASFSASQAAVSRTAAPAIIAAYDFSKFDRIVDVGGANGALLAAILSSTPQASGIVFDLPPVVHGKRSQCSERLDSMGAVRSSGEVTGMGCPRVEMPTSSSRSSWTIRTTRPLPSSATSGARWAREAPCSSSSDSSASPMKAPWTRSSISRC